MGEPTFPYIVEAAGHLRALPQFELGAARLARFERGDLHGLRRRHGRVRIRDDDGLLAHLLRRLPLAR